MSVVVNAALAGPKTFRYSNIYGALSNNGVLSNLGATDVLGGSEPLAVAIVSSLGGAIFAPTQSNCWQDADRAVPGAYDKKVYLMDDVTGAFTATQATDVSKPYLRSADYSIIPFVSATGETWTPTYTVIDAAGGFERSGSDAYFRNSAGTSGQNVSTPNAAANQITGDICIVAKVRVDNIGVNFTIADKMGASGNYGYVFYINTTGKQTFGFSVDGTAVIYPGGTNPVSQGVDTWLRIKRTAATGAYIHETSLDGVNWTANGSGTDTAGNIFASTDVVTLGAGFPGANGRGRIYYAAAWANTTGTGTPAWEFYPARDATFPASPWLQTDGSNDYFVTNIIPGNYSAGFVCAGAVQIEAMGGTNAIFGSSASAAVRGIRTWVTSVNLLNIHRFDGSLETSRSTTETLTQNIPFVGKCSYTPTSAAVRLNSGVENTSPVSRDYRGSTQYALMGATNNAESGVTPTNYIQGNIHALVWLPVIPTEAQELAIRNYVASKAGVTL